MVRAMLDPKSIINRRKFVTNDFHVQYKKPEVFLNMHGISHQDMTPDQILQAAREKGWNDDARILEL